LAGGVAAGPVAALQMEPWGGLLLGLATGLAVVLCGLCLEPLLARGLGLPTSYYIVSIHGLPALIGGLAGVLLAAIAEEKSGSMFKLEPGGGGGMGVKNMKERRVRGAFVLPRGSGVRPGPIQVLSCPSLSTRPVPSR
jgi:ammonia channel protein AmtB